MEYNFSAANKALWVAGKLIQLKTKEGYLLPILADPANHNHIVEIAKGVASATPLVAVNPPFGLSLIAGQIAMSAGQAYQNHKGFQAVLGQLNAIQSSLVVLQSTTALIGVGTLVGVVLSAVNLHQTLKLREDVKQLRLEVKDGFIDLERVLKNQGEEIIQRIREVAQDVEFRDHRTILVRAYGRFLQAINRIKIAMSSEDLSIRDADLANARQTLDLALSDYNSPHLFSEISAPGQLRRMECAWAIEQTIALTYQLQNQLAAVSNSLSHLQDKIRQDALTVIDRCETENELDFLFPELTRIHNQDLAVLESWQNHVDWMRSLPPSELKLLQSSDFDNLEITGNTDTNPDTTVLIAPPEELLYENLKQKSHSASLRDQLLFMMKPDLRCESEAYITQQAAIAGYKTLVPANLQKASNLAVANLYWYFKVRDESEDEIEEEDELKELDTERPNVPSVTGNFNDKIFTRLKIIIAEQLEVEREDVTPEAHFAKDLNADSLDAVELIIAFEEEFDIEIPDEAAEQITTVQQAVDYISQKTTSRKKS